MRTQVPELEYDISERSKRQWCFLIQIWLKYNVDKPLQCLTIHIWIRASSVATHRMILSLYSEWGAERTEMFTRWDSATERTVKCFRLHFYILITVILLSCVPKQNYLKRKFKPRKSQYTILIFIINHIMIMDESSSN
jgi:hypothetical protein